MSIAGLATECAFIDAVSGLVCWCGRGVHVTRPMDADALDVSCPRCGAAARVDGLSLRACTRDGVSRLMYDALERLRRLAAERAWRKLVTGYHELRLPLSPTQIQRELIDPDTDLPMQVPMITVNMLKRRAVLLDAPKTVRRTETWIREPPEIISVVTIPQIAFTMEMMTSMQMPDHTVDTTYYQKRRDLGFGWHEYHRMGAR